MIGRKRTEGKPIPEKAEDKLWRAEFEKLSIDQHNNKLKEMGLEDDDIKEFDEMFFSRKAPAKK